jgi:hypothetical protein
MSGARDLDGAVEHDRSGVRAGSRPSRPYPRAFPAPRARELLGGEHRNSGCPAPRQRLGHGATIRGTVGCAPGARGTGSQRNQTAWPDGPPVARLSLARCARSPPPISDRCGRQQLRGVPDELARCARSSCRRISGGRRRTGGRAICPPPTIATHDGPCRLVTYNHHNPRRLASSRRGCQHLFVES